MRGNTEPLTPKTLESHTLPYKQKRSLLSETHSRSFTSLSPLANTNFNSTIVYYQPHLSIFFPLFISQLHLNSHSPFPYHYSLTTLLTYLSSLFFCFMWGREILRYQNSNNYELQWLPCSPKGLQWVVYFATLFAVDWYSRSSGSRHCLRSQILWSRGSHVFHFKCPWTTKTG